MSCIERAGWFSGVLSAVRVYQSVSISGPSATTKPIDANSCSAFERAADRMQAALRAAATGQRHIERFCGELGLQRGFTQPAAACFERVLGGHLGGVDRCARLAARVRVELAERLETFGERANLAKIARLGLFELRAIGRRAKVGCGLLQQLIELFHVPALAKCGVAG